MSDFIHWPAGVLPPAEIRADLVAFSRGGGRSLGGIERSTRSDRGYWEVQLGGVPVHTRAQRRAWDAVRSQLAGRAGLLVVPVWSFDSAPYVTGQYESLIETPYEEDEGVFDDSTQFVQGSIALEMATYAPLGATVVQLRAVSAAAVAGIRFSYQYALYETGPIVSQAGDVYQVSISPAIRRAIPQDAQLEANEPSCIVRLKEDRGLDLPSGIEPLYRGSATFVEAVDYWNDLALAEAA